MFLDETWASTNMARRRGRCARGLRLLTPIPHGHWKTTTLIAGLRTMLRKAAERTRDGLWTAIGRAIDLYKPDECRNLFKNAGYAT